MTGSIVYACDQGLGYLAKDFFDHGIIQKVYIQEHSTRPSHREWYPRESLVSSPKELLEQCDSFLFFETPFDWKIIPKARQRQKKTALMVMYECTPNPLPYQPDIIICPSELDLKYYPKTFRLDVPVDIGWRLRKKAEVFVHNAGNGGLGGRNGTKELLEAMKMVRSPIKLILRTQVSLHFDEWDQRIEVRAGTFEDIWSEGDVFVFPEKFNGLSLPLQEAFASGMMVMGSRRFPMNTWLPIRPLIPVSSYRKERLAVEFDSAVVTPQEIAKSIDYWYGRDITKYSLLGKVYNEQNSWSVLKDSYKELMLQ